MNSEINVSRKKGYIEVTGGLKDGYKAFHITQQGLENVDSFSLQSKKATYASASMPRSREVSSFVSTSRKQKEDQSHLVNIVNLVKTCDEAEAIEKQILDSNNEVNRALLPLYINHKYLDDNFSLKTTQIAKITKDLGTPVTRQNTLRALKFKGSKYVLSDDVRKPGQATCYKLNRRGVQYMNSVIQGTAN